MKVQQNKDEVKECPGLKASPIQGPEGPCSLQKPVLRKSVSSIAGRVRRWRTVTVRPCAIFIAGGLATMVGANADSPTIHSRTAPCAATMGSLEDSA